MTKDKKQFKNRLQHSSSPYLLQHARNPVDWYEWCDEAFETAAQEDKPIFLSIGYSTCHWCHVMEHESFEDEEVARLMNETFVSIKVDREERPDIDHVYMTVCRMTSSNCGWPLNIIMTPDKRPFLVATYIPRNERFDRPGMLQLIPAVKQYWLTRRAEVNESADKIVTVLAGMSLGKPGEIPGPSISDTTYEQLRAAFDAKHGGFGVRPKFPSPHNLLFLLRYWQMNDVNEALSMVEKTLQEMRRGGLFDHIGYGFHRYSTDARWLLPHFEKMLYDQALLTIAYIEAYQATGKEEYARVAREILSYVLQEMTNEKGGFYSAEDADSKGEEGKFYLWSIDEINDVLDPEEAELFIRIFNITAEGTYREEATGEARGTNIPHLQDSVDLLAEQNDLDTDELIARIETMREKLFRAREKRIHPGKDDKILTDWNGLMIAALGKAAQVLGEQKYAKAAADATAFILSQMRSEDGRLLHRYREGEAGIEAYADDYSFMTWGLLELYEATFDPGFLRTALELNDLLMKFFWDEKSGGLFFTSVEGERLIVRSKELNDGTVPSANSVALSNFLRLSRMTGDQTLEEKAESLVRAFAETVKRAPGAFTYFICGLQFLHGDKCEVVVVGDPGAGDTQEMIRTLRSRYFPNNVVLLKPDGGNDEEIVKLAPFTDNQSAINGRATAYVCRDYVCSRSTIDIETMMELISKE